MRTEGVVVVDHVDLVYSITHRRPPLHEPHPHSGRSTNWTPRSLSIRARSGDICRGWYSMPGVGHAQPHAARGDALAALRLARALAKDYPEIAALSAKALHELQVGAAREQAASFAVYLERKGVAPREVGGDWPVKPFPTPGGQQLPSSSRATGQ